MKELEEQLKNSPNNNIFVSISAASNVTSTLTDLKAFNEVISNIDDIQEESAKTESR